MSAQAKKAFVLTTLGILVLAAALAAFLVPIPARAGTATFRIDPEARPHNPVPGGRDGGRHRHIASRGSVWDEHKAQR